MIAYAGRHMGKSALMDQHTAELLAAGQTVRYACLSTYEQARLATIQRELYRIDSHDGPFCEREVTAHRHRGHTITVYTYRLRPRFVMHWAGSAKVPASRSVIANYLRWARRAPGFRVMRDGLHKYRVLGYSSDAIHFEALP